MTVSLFDLYLCRANATFCFCSYAIKGAPGQRLLLEDIYYAIGARSKCFSWIVLS